MRVNVSPFDAYTTYLALKQHFTRDSYDIFKYQGKVSASSSSFEKRRDRYYFEKLAKKSDPRSYILANLLNDPNMWVGTLVQDPSSEVTYAKWQKRIQSLLYTFREDLGQLDDDFDANFKASANEHPYLLKLFLRNKICIETLTILLHMTKAYGRWDKLMQNDPIWLDVAKKIRKYQPFINYELEKFKKVVIDKFSE